MDSKDRFHRQFQNSAASLQDQISHLSSFSAVGGERQDAVEHILSGISRLSNQVADAADEVPAYDQRVYSEVVKALREQLNEETAKFAPKARFQFKRRAANAAAAVETKPDTRRLNFTDGSSSSSKPAAAQPDEDGVGSLPTFDKTATATASNKNYNDEIARSAASTGGIRKPSFSAARDITLSDHEHLHILLPVSASRATSGGTLTNLRRCVVDMSVPTAAAGGGAPFASLTLRDIARSVVVAGHVDGPLHVTGVRDSVLVVAARQVRIHECENVVFYLFDQVDDFKWLKTTSSPNWSLLPESDIVPHTVWRKTLAGCAGLGVDTILRNLGVPRD